MRFGAAYWVQRMGWPELRQAVLHAESSGFDDQWVDDHLLSDEGAWQDAKLEGWSTLAAVAAVTRTSRLGLMVAANTFRNPGLTAKLATTLDHLSEGRAILGIGAGLVRPRARGVRAGLRQRLRRAPVTACRGRAAHPPASPGEHVKKKKKKKKKNTRRGRFYQFEDAVCAPSPIQAHLPILIGGSGPTKTLPLIADRATSGTPMAGPRSSPPPTRSCAPPATPSGATSARSSGPSTRTS